MNLNTFKEIIFWISIFVLTLFVAKYRQQLISPKLKGNPASRAARMNSPSVNDRINDYMLEAHIQKDAQKRQAEVDNYSSPRDVSNDSIQDLNQVTATRSDYSLRIRPENAAEKVFQELNENFKSSKQKTPADELLSELAYQQWLDEYDEENKQIFFNKIKQYAKEQGLQVEFDSSFNIKSVKRIKPKAVLSY